MRITLVTHGAPKQSFVREGVAEFIKRISRYAHIELVHLDEKKKEKDIAASLARMAHRGLLVLLDERGVEHTSPSLAQYLEDKKMHCPHLVLCIGGADGHTPLVRALPHESLSLSRLTLPHELALLVCTEALYRALSIQAGHPYHRA